MKYIILLLLLTTFLIAKNLIDINFKDLKLKELIQITSENIDKNILVTQEIKGKVDFISNQPLSKDKLLDILKYSLEANGYSLIEEGDILRVVKEGIVNEVIEKPQKTVEVIKYISPVQPNNIVNESVHTEVIPLKNVDAKAIEQILKSIVSKRVYLNKLKPSISIDEAYNFLILDGGLDEVISLKNIVKKLDITKQQVYVKAKIVEVDDNLVEDIGIKYGLLGGKVHSGGIYTFSSSLNNGTAVSVDTGTIGLQIPNVSSTLALGATLNLLNRTYALDVISQPSILCLDNNESSIYVGETISMQTGTTTTDGGNTKTTYKREDIGLTLKVKPRVSNDNKVTLNINTILEGIKNTNTSSLNPDTSKKEVKTTAIVNNGESVIIGGLIEKKNEKTIQKIPLASEVPLIGELFKNRLTDNQNRNLVVIVTPYIIPKDKDLTFVRNELTKLKNLEDEFLESVLINLKTKKSLTVNEKQNNQMKLNEKLHKERLKRYFGI